MHRAGSHPRVDLGQEQVGDAELQALVDLAPRAGENPVARRAAPHLRAIAETGDLHAVPA